jgi:hypothetical protein
LTPEVPNNVALDLGITALSLQTGCVAAPVARTRRGDPELDECSLSPISAGAIVLTATSSLDTTMRDVLPSELSTRRMPLNAETHNPAQPGNDPPHPDRSAALVRSG